MPKTPLRKPLCLTFDAFGTLLHPRASIKAQYAAAARNHGLSGFTDYEIGQRFRVAYGDAIREHPNYGKAVGMGTQKWWANIIHAIFAPYVSTQMLFPEGLIPELLTRFSSSEGYKLYPDVLPFFQQLRAHKRSFPEAPVTVGVVTNSDDRVPGVLTSLGLSVADDARFGVDSSTGTAVDDPDIDFVALSYDIGVGKPERRIFKAAEELLRRKRPTEDEDYHFLHVGDDLQKDFAAARAAGWESVLLDRKLFRRFQLLNKTEGRGVEDEVERIRTLVEMSPRLGLGG